ncbi:MAG: xanthine dehydrogenase family protein subunit M [Deltaproteobacteria bacterium]|nr:xanthine dehydrogenase family protein subunit M [Deltaproteobacteria bacterium]
MSYPKFRYAVPKTVRDAVEILHAATEKGEKAIVLAGGTDLMVQLREKSLVPDLVVDISRVTSLTKIERMGNEIRIGPLVTHSMLASSDLIREYVGVLSEAARTVGSPQIRNLGTLGGNIVNASPAADTIPALVILDAQLILTGPKGDRTLPITDFFEGPYETVIEADELLTGVIVPLPPPSGRAIFLKLARRKALAIARMNLACMLYYNRQKEVFEWVRLCVGSSTPRPVRMTEAEKILEGQPFTDVVLQKAGQAAAEQMVALSGLRSSTAYKKPVVGDLVIRAVKLAVEKG